MNHTGVRSTGSRRRARRMRSFMALKLGPGSGSWNGVIPHALRGLAAHSPSAPIQRVETATPENVMTNRMRRAPIVLAVVLTGCNVSDDGRRTAVLAATHTLEDSGLLDSLAVAFRTVHPELHLRIMVSGTGEALEH